MEVTRVNEAQRSERRVDRLAGPHCAMPDGMIKPGSNVGEQLGFTPSLFDGWLWKDGDRIMISMIVSKREGQGNLSRLFASIEAHGLRVAVPSPLGHMEEILRHKDFVPHVERDETLGNVEVWMRPNYCTERSRLKLRP